MRDGVIFMTLDTYLRCVRHTVVILLSTGWCAHPGLILQLANKVEGGIRLGKGEGSSGLGIVHLEEFPVRGAPGECRLLLWWSQSRDSYFDFQKNQVYFQLPVHVGGWCDGTQCARLRVSKPTGAVISWQEWLEPASFDLDSSARRAELVPGETPGIRSSNASVTR